MSDELAEIYLEIPRQLQTNYPAVSNTELNSANQCLLQHYFAFILGLKLRENNENIAHGVLGHKALAAYYNARMHTGHDEAKHEALQIYYDDKKTDTVIKMLNMKRIMEYLAKYENEQFEVLMVEEVLMVDMNGSTFPFTLDLLIRTARGAIVLRDWKIVEKFWHENKAKWTPQLYKYTWALKKLGHNVVRAEYDLIKMVDSRDGEQFRRVPVPLHNQKLNTIMQEHELGAQRVIERRKLTIRDARATAIRNLHYGCINCPFNMPCEMDMEGRDISRVLAVEYEANDYGYQK